MDRRGGEAMGTEGGRRLETGLAADRHLRQTELKRMRSGILVMQAAIDSRSSVGRWAQSTR